MLSGWVFKPFSLTQLTLDSVDTFFAHSYYPSEIKKITQLKIVHSKSSKYIRFKTGVLRGKKQKQTFMLLRLSKRASTARKKRQSRKATTPTLTVEYFQTILCEDLFPIILQKSFILIYRDAEAARGRVLVQRTLALPVEVLRRDAAEHDDGEHLFHQFGSTASTVIP